MNQDAIERAWRDERTALVATLAARLGDLDLAEDAVQEAFAAAVRRWPVDGVPANAAAWLMTAAWRRALDVRRRTRPTVDVNDAPDAAVATPPHDVPDDTELPVRDDILRLILACAHPALTPESHVALTLRHVCGLSAREIAAALLVQEAAVEKRLVRARAKMREARIAFTLPSRDELPERLADAHAVVYLVFTEGYLASGDSAAIRESLCDDAVWLASELAALVPDDAETLGLLALLRLQHARRHARADADGGLIPLDAQDRGQWDGAAIEHARALLGRAHGLGGAQSPGPYQLEAAIALLHANSPTPSTVPWARIAELYTMRLRLDDSPVVAINRAVAVGHAHGAAQGLAALAPVLADARVQRYAPLHVAHADLLERAGAPDAARAAWTRAAALTNNPEARRAIERRRASLP